MNDNAKKYFDSLKGKKVAFVGMGVANIPCAEFFAKLGIDVYACDKRDKDYIGKDICDKLEKLGVNFSLGENYLDVLPKMDLVFRSHGILPFQNPWIGECIAHLKLLPLQALTVRQQQQHLFLNSLKHRAKKYI